jgi:2-polyprenyl-3-methyl-5-hydroxy-6-metoxy-1,4-benzoquinol methylase
MTVLGKMKRAARAITQTFPALEPSARKAQFELWRGKVKLQGRLSTDEPLADLLWIDPAFLVDVSPWPPRGKRVVRGTGPCAVADGDWDRVTDRFDELALHAALRARFADGASWSESGYGDAIRAGLGADRAGDLDARCRALDHLYQIASASAERVTPLSVVPEPGPTEPPEVAAYIGRHGDVIVHDGHERLTIAKLAGLSQIPVRITARHAGWVDFVREVLAYAREHSGRIYSVIQHPDLAHVPAIHGRDRVEMIADNLPTRTGVALDIGCHWGFYCQRLEELGLSCVGVESEYRHVYFARKLRRAERHDYTLVQRSIFDYDDRCAFDVVLALYVLHHLIKTEPLHRALVALLGRLEMGSMVFGCHNNDQPGMQTAYRNYTPDEFVSFLIEHSTLTRARLIGTEAGRRNLYLLEA